MSGGTDLNSVLNAAIRCLLRPVVRLLLRHAVPFATFERLAKAVYVEAGAWPTSRCRAKNPPPRERPF